MSRQLSFDLPMRAALGRSDFFVCPSNAMAVALIEGWGNWPARKLVLLAETGAGKTHLAHVWAALARASILPARDVTEDIVPPLSQTNLVLEDIQNAVGNLKTETALFHLHNLALSEGNALLFTANAPLATLNFALPDLQSRLQGAQSATLDRPDDTLLAAVLMKLFADRQLIPSADTVPYLVTRMNRSLAEAQRIVDLIDKTALSEKRAITRKLAIEVLERDAQNDLLDN